MASDRWSDATLAESSVGLFSEKELDGRRSSFSSSGSATEAHYAPAERPACLALFNRGTRLSVKRLLLYCASLAAVLLLVVALPSKQVAPHLKSLQASLARTTGYSRLSGVTIVSAFFVVSDGKKHSLDDYWYWIGIFLSNVDQPVVFYTSPDLVDKIAELRGDKPITIIADYAKANLMPPVQELGGARWEEQMNKIDPEPWIHVPGVYGPWTAKPWMLQNAKDKNVYKSKYFFWADAGGFRDETAKHHFRALPTKLDAIYKNEVPEDTIILGDANKWWPNGLDYVKAVNATSDMDRSDSHIQGGWFGGHVAALGWWKDETLKMTKLQSGLQRFAGKEQDIWTHTARVFWPKVLVFNMFDNNGKCGYDQWFAYEYWADTEDCWINSWNGPKLALEEQH